MDRRSKKKEKTKIPQGSPLASAIEWLGNVGRGRKAKEKWETLANHEGLVRFFLFLVATYVSYCGCADSTRRQGKRKVAHPNCCRMTCPVV